MFEDLKFKMAVTMADVRAWGDTASPVPVMELLQKAGNDVYQIRLHDVKHVRSPTLPHTQHEEIRKTPNPPELALFRSVMYVTSIRVEFCGVLRSGFEFSRHFAPIVERVIIGKVGRQLFDPTGILIFLQQGRELLKRR